MKKQNKKYTKVCKQCGRTFTTNNKHRNRCLICCEEHPYIPSKKKQQPFIRKNFY